MKSLKEVLQDRTKQARTMEAIVKSIIQDMIDTANQGGTMVSWREDEEYYPNVKVVEVFAHLNTFLAAEKYGLLAELKDNQEHIKSVFERNKTYARPRNLPELRQWLVVGWEV